MIGVYDSSVCTVWVRGPRGLSTRTRVDRDASRPTGRRFLGTPDGGQGPQNRYWCQKSRTSLRASTNICASFTLKSTPSCFYRHCFAMGCSSRSCTGSRFRGAPTHVDAHPRSSCHLSPCADSNFDNANAVNTHGANPYPNFSRNYCNSTTPHSLSVIPYRRLNCRSLPRVVLAACRLVSHVDRVSYNGLIRGRRQTWYANSDIWSICPFVGTDARTVGGRWNIFHSSTASLRTSDHTDGISYPDVSYRYTTPRFVLASRRTLSTSNRRRLYYFSHKSDTAWNSWSVSRPYSFGLSHSSGTPFVFCFASLLSYTTDDGALRTTP